MERCTADRFIFGDFPQHENGHPFVASLLTGAMASFGIERKSNEAATKKPSYRCCAKDTKAGIKWTGHSTVLGVTLAAALPARAEHHPQDSVLRATAKLMALHPQASGLEHSFCQR